MKNKIQRDAQDKWLETLRGTLAMATGVGKSKVFINILVDLFKTNPNTTVCLIVPTEKLRDENWREEFIKWGAEELYNKIDRYCYASVSKVKKNYDMICADEIHNITELNSVFFELNKEANILGLTATPPDEIEKKALLNKYCPVVFTYTLQQGVEDGIVVPFRIKIVEIPLDSVNKTVTVKTKENEFQTTEANHYKYLTSLVMKARYSGNKNLEKFRTLHRMKFLYSLKSKTELAKKILSKYLSDKKTLIFCGTIAQAEELCENRYHSKTGDKAFRLFAEGKINHLSSVKALNEGMNIPELDAALIVQGSSQKREIIQRIGRLVRWRENHTADIWILNSLDTQDVVWTAKALEHFPKNIIEYIHHKNL